MQTFEYKVVPAPNRSKRIKGVKGTAGRFAAVLTETMNEQAAEGWEYLRSDSLPVEEKPGLLKSRVETYQTVLVFRRTVVADETTAMAGYIEDQTDMVEAEPDPVVEPAHTPESAQEPTELPAEPAVSSDWAETTEYPADPPMTSQAEDSPFAQPENAADDPATR
ncbi:DUF4177 domain-containing protein [Amylibacter sp. IMCC11727]|uniref:DUF4177 domain-containing protein n=1 Tax=Amylibacter sp. IMCC11727 TaxID=3039851 RepID=UPI00244E126B|nr:DUF4177 domain-containing protein [Amylibacter sp. IMCC11727]WGI21059.1 DUF4177 domain-containing protein [Amylibacter sp. IMCC11727]